MPEGLTLAATLRYGAFAVVAVVLPGIALQRLQRLRADPALVLPLGLAFCALAYWLSLIASAAWLFVVLVLALDVTLLWTRFAWSDGPPVRGALWPFAMVVALFALTVYRHDQLDAEGAFLASGALPDDAIFHVGLTHELALSGSPQVPGLSGFSLSYHLGASLVRAAALRFAGIHPYDALARFDNTLYALALILALRAAARALGGSALAVSLAGFSVLASDFSFLLAPGKGLEWWVGLFEGGTGLLSLFHANSLVPALALALGSIVALSRFQAGGGKAFLRIAVALAFACAFFKVFLAAQLLGALALATLLAEDRRPVAVLALAAGVGLLPLALGRAGDTMQVALAPLAVLNDARDDLGWERLDGARLLLWLLPWLFCSLGLRMAGLPEALRALVSRRAVPVALAAFALAGWPLGLLFRVSPLEAGLRARPFNEALYFFEQSGLCLWLFAALAIGASSMFPARRRAVLVGAAALLTLPSTVQYAWQERTMAPRRIPPQVVRAMQALTAASAPGDVVLVRPEQQRYPPPPLLVGRRVPFTRFIPFFNQLASRETLQQRYERVRSFFETEDPAVARAAARELGAGFVALSGAEDVRFEKGGLLELVYEDGGARVFRISAGATLPAPRR